ncbi:MAG: PD-(D/E)XK nuclease family protein [Elusimicrobia bacterium]|nr:PD-(D/E)XK nuclease family protein [Elusimicrobiota bacterium]
MRFSPSRLDTYKNCPRQYKFRYIDRLPRKGTTVEAHLGTSVHKALELLYAGLQHGKRMTEAEVVAAYEDAWTKGAEQPMTFHNKSYTLEDWRRLGVECVTSYYRAHQPFDADKTVSVEGRLGFPLQIRDTDGGGETPVRIEGYIDRLALGSDGVFEIHDYKTGKSLPTQADKDQDWQLAIYNIGVLEAWPDAPGVRLIWHYLRHGKAIVSTRSKEQLESLKGEIRSLIETIRRDQVFEPTKSALCDWCDYRDVCPLFKHAEACAALPEAQRAEDSGVKLVDAYAALDHRKKTLREVIAAVESEQEDLEKKLLDFADRGGLQTVAGTDATIDVHEKEEYKFPSRTQAPEKIEAIESKLKETETWTQVSRLDPKSLMDGFKKRRWPEAVMQMIEGWVDKLIRHETSRSVRLHRRKDSEEE